MPSAGTPAAVDRESQLVAIDAMRDAEPHVAGHVMPGCGQTGAALIKRRFADARVETPKARSRISVGSTFPLRERGLCTFRGFIANMQGHDTFGGSSFCAKVNLALALRLGGALGGITCCVARVVQICAPGYSTPSVLRRHALRKPHTVRDGAIVRALVRRRGLDRARATTTESRIGDRRRSRAQPDPWESSIRESLRGVRSVTAALPLAWRKFLVLCCPPATECRRKLRYDCLGDCSNVVRG